MRELRFGAAALALVAAPALAQQGTFDSGSTGADGALTFAAGAGTIDFDPTDQARFGRVLDPDGDNVYHFTSVTVGTGTTVRLRTTHLPEGRPVVWLVSGDVKIDGTLDLNGADGHAWNGTFAPAVAGAGGYTGGTGQAPGAPNLNGNGPGGGLAGNGTDHFGGNAAHVVLGQVSVTNQPVGGGPTYGNVHVRPMVGGSGGGGAAILSGRSGSGGGGGGGALLIASSSRIDVTGAIRAQGGNGGTRQDTSAAGGGGGSGGALRLIAPVVAGAGTINVTGGQASGLNEDASHGRVRVESFLSPTTPSVVPGQAITRSAPSAVFLTAAAPLVKVVRVAGVTVAANPTGSFVVPDVAINAPGAVIVELEARNVPAGTVLNLTFQPESAAQVTVSSTPLVAGAGGVLTATASVTFNGGFTRVFVRANWTP